MSTLSVQAEAGVAAFPPSEGAQHAASAAGPGGLATLRRHWPEYLIEATGLGVFMISACVFATVLEHPGSPVRQPVCGGVVRFSPDGKTSEVYAHGFRNPYDLDFNSAGQLFTVDADGYNVGEFNLSGHPSLSVPAGTCRNGIPFGLLVNGPRWRDDLVLAFAAAWEEARPWPPVAPGHDPFGALVG